MGLQVQDWDGEEAEKVEETISFLASVNNLEPDKVIDGVRRQVKLEDETVDEDGGRPSKVEIHTKAILDVLQRPTEDIPKNLVREELQKRIEDAVQDLSHQTELELRRELEKELNIGFRQPFESFSKENGDYEDLLILKKEFQE